MTQDLYNLFKPMLTPKQMLKKGIFGGTYFNQLVEKASILINGVSLTISNISERRRAVSSSNLGSPS